MKLSLLFWLIWIPASLHAGWTFTPPELLPASKGIEFSRRVAEDSAKKAEIHLVMFNGKTHTLVVLDNPEGAYQLDTAAGKRGVLAGVNGGYFHPDRTPLGLVIRQGQKIHEFEKAKLLGGVIGVTKEKISIQRAAEYKPSAAIREALQAGPFLVDGGKAVTGLDGTRSAARTVVLTDGQNQFALLICRSVTLAEMAEILATPGLLPKGKVLRAINLDGGSSTALWVKQEPKPFYVPEWKTVRNYLGVVAK